MREIEVKARVNNLESLVDKIKTQNIKLGPKLEQHDIVYGQPGKTDNEFGSVWLRVRVENKTKTYFTLKKSVRGHLDSIEYEVVVNDPDELKYIITQMGFKLYSDLTKVRQKAKIGNIELCVDHLVGLGDYVEAEMLVTDYADYKRVETELWDFLNTLGVSKGDEELRGYDVIERANRE